MKKREPQVGDFIRYAWDPQHVVGFYGLVFIKDPKDITMNNGQAVWFGEKAHCKKHQIDYEEFNVSGIWHNKLKRDCKVVKAPRKILNRIEHALKYLKANKYRVDNLTYIELLAKAKRFV